MSSQLRNTWIVLIMAVMLAGTGQSQISRNQIRNDAYGAAWNGDNYLGASRNALYDVISGLAPGDPDTLAIAALNPVANDMLYWTGVATPARLVTTAYGRSLVAVADAAAAALTLQQDGWVDVRWYGATGGDGGDDLAAVQAAATAATGKTVYFPPGNWHLSGTVTIPADTTVRGTGSASVLIPTAAHFALTLSGGDAEVFSLKIDGEGTGGGISAGADTDLLRIVDVNIVNTAYGDAISTAEARHHNRIEVRGCHIANCLDGIWLAGRYGSAVIAGNLIDTLAETGAVHGIHLGNNTVADRDEMLHAVVADNTVLNVTTTGVGSEAHAIMVYGQRGIVTGNRIDTVYNHATSTAGDEGLYVKLQFGQVTNNLLVDAGRSSNGALCSKSVLECLIAGNTVVAEDLTGRVGIYADGDNVRIYDNSLYGLSGVAIAVGTADNSDHNDVQICRNTLIGHKGSSGIIYENNGGEGCRINDNLIYGLPGSEGTPSHVYGIQFIAEDGDTNDVEICRNTVTDSADCAASTSIRGLFVQLPDAGSRVNGLRIEGNHFAMVSTTITAYGIYMSLGVRAVNDLVIQNNSAASLAGLSTVPLYISTADAAVCELKGFSGNTFDGAVGLGAARCTHTYGGGTTAWAMTTGETFGSLFYTSSAGGAADAVFPAAIPGKQFTVYNNSGAAITFKVNGQAGSAVANGKYASFVMDATDCREIYEQP